MNKIIESLGLNWQHMLFYAINIIILVVVLRLLIYKPIKKIIEKRREHLEYLDNENKKLNEEALELKKNYEKTIIDTKHEVSRMTEEVTKTAESKRIEILYDAQKKADEIIAKATHDMEQEKMRSANIYKQQIPDISMEIAKKIVKRELTQKDNQKVIEDALNDWEN